MKKSLFFLFLLNVFFIFAQQSLTVQAQKALYEYYNNLSEPQKISQIFLVNIFGNTTFTPVENASGILKDYDEPLVPGGVLMFSYNLSDTPKEVISFISSINNYCVQHNLVSPYISVDQEGGVVNRLKNLTSYLPSNKRTAELNNSQVYELYALQAKQMKALGFHMNLAPVAEASFIQNQEFLQTRSYGNVSRMVTCSMAAIRAYEDNQITAVAKHFPGNTNTDPHSGLPELNYSLEQLETNFVLPFALVVKAMPGAVLMSHARTSCLDRKTPSCLSYEWVHNQLQNRLGFDGLILSDDIFMGALAKNGFPPEIACEKAIEAGVNVIMLSEKRFASVASLLLKKAATDYEFAQKLKQSELKVLEYKIKKGILKILEDEHGNLKVAETLITAEQQNKQQDEFTLNYKLGVEFYNKSYEAKK